MGELNNMSPVANVKTKGYKGKSDKQVIDAVMANFKKRGYGVDRKGFGFISLEEEFINRSLNYLNTEAEYAAFDVLPQVLKNGKEIRDDEHKGRGHNTVTFAAPVVINGKAGIMGAVVMRTKGNRYKTHRIVMPDGSQYIFEQEKTEVTTSGMTGEKIHGEGPDIASAINDSISQTDKKDNGKISLKDSDGRELSEQQQEYFKDSKIRDEDGNLLVVYHGSSESFNTFDRTKTRANMDIQGNFFSPWEIDAGGYGENVRAFYLNINNPASSGVAYSALNKFKGQNNAGVKAREYLESQGYDGVNNDGEEYIAFYPEQIKSVDNSNSTSDPDIRYSMKESFSNQVDGALAGTLDRNNHVFVCETPQILRAVGLNDLPMLMTQKHIRNINKGADGSRKHYHGISRDVIKKIPQYLQEPVAIMDSLSTATQPGVVVLTEEVDSEGRPIVIAIKPDGQGFYDVDLDSNFILSMYGRNNFEKFLEDNVKESTFLYISNKKTEPTGAGVPIENDRKGSAISSVSENSVTPTGRKSNKRFSLKEPVEENEVHEYEVGDDEERIAKVNEVAEHKDVKFSLKNENLSPDARIPYTVYQSYISVKKNDNAALKNLQDNVRKLKRGTYENKATGYKADINRVTIGKILNPSGGNGFNRWSIKYIDNLNAATQLPELFENAVYVDTKGNQKAKKANQQIQGYHHFVAPIYMDDKEYRARIVAREKQNSDTLYIVETEIMPIKNGSSGSRSKASYFVSVPFDISIPELVNGVKIYDYNMQKKIFITTMISNIPCPTKHPS